MTIAVLVALSALQHPPPDSARKDTVVLPPIEVVSSILPIAGPRIRSGIPARIATLSGREIDAWEPRTLADALGSRAGVSIYDDLGSPYKLNLTTRGFNVGPVVGLPPGISVFLDGVRQNEPDAAQVNFDLLPLEHVKRIELLSGAGSLLGSNSLGGAVNLITRRGEGPLGAELEASGGSFDTYSAEASVAGRSISRGWDYYLGGGYERAAGWRHATLARGHNAFANVGHLGPERGIGLQLFGATSYAETAGSLPESIFRSDPRANFTAGDFEDLDLAQIAVTGYAPLLSGRGSATVYARRHTAERFNVNQPPDPDVRGLSRNRTVGANLDWQWEGERGAGRPEMALRAGLDGAANAVNIRLFEGAALTTDVDSPSWDVAAYATGDITLGSATLSAGVRYDQVRVPFKNNLDPASDTSSTFTRFNPRAGVSVAAGAGGTLYGSVGQSFRAPVILELACADETAACPLPFALGDDPPLDPVVGTTYEMGARWAVGRILLDGALYRTDVRDDISFIASDSAVYAGYFANIGATRREGVELSAQAQWSAGHSVYANYAYTHASFRTAADIFSLRSDSAYVTSPYFGENAVVPGDRLPLVPEHQVRVGVAMALGRGLDAGIDARYTGRQWLRGDEANETRPLDAYVAANLRVAWERRGGTWSIAGIVANVFDSQRAVFGTFNENRQTGELERFLTPLQARSFKLIVRRGFGS
jgi:outer membrane receptor protein involved in Fe transport